MFRKLRRILTRLQGKDLYHLADIEAWQAEIVRRVRPFSMAGAERVLATINAVEHVVRSDVPGAIVECGV